MLPWMRLDRRASPASRNILNSLGQSIDLNQFNLVPKAGGAHAAENRGWVGHVSNYPDRIRARLPVWVRVLHCNGIFWRLHPVSALMKAL